MENMEAIELDTMESGLKTKTFIQPRWYQGIFAGEHGPLLGGILALIFLTCLFGALSCLMGTGTLLSGTSLTESKSVTMFTYVYGIMATASGVIIYIGVLKITLSGSR